MTLGLSLALPLGAGLHRDSGPITLRRKFATAWGKTEVFVANTTPWEVTRPRAWRHHGFWSLRYAGTHVASYGLHLAATRLHPYGDLRRHRVRLAMPFGELFRTQASHLLPYAELRVYRQSRSFPYWLTQQAAIRLEARYDVTNVNPLTKQLTAPWSLLEEQHLQAVVNSPELLWHGRPLRLLEATLSCDEESPVWIAQLELAELADFAALGIGDTLTLVLGLETFVLVVDGKSLAREAVSEQRCTVSAVSPVALLDSPFAGTIRFYQPLADFAEAAVESLLGPVTWHLPSWSIPAGQLLLDGVTPLAAARNIVAAIGGLIESNPDGTLVCRYRHPVNVPDYDAVTVAHSLFDSEVISARSQLAPSRGFNRVTVANEAGGATASSDRIEFVADPNDAQQGTVLAYLSTARPVLLTHTGHAATVISSLGEVLRTETETLEFLEGRASTRYPVTAIIVAVWQHTDLGAVAAEGQSLSASTAGFSLLRVTYTVKSLNWRVALASAEEVQFVLVDV